jgi:hypothetical protein
MTSVERRLYVAGVTLFLFGLALGFAVPAFADRSGVLTAHLTALGSGTFLIVIGVIWRKVDLGRKGSSLLAHVLWGSFYILQAGLTLNATRTPGQSSQSTAQAVAGVLNTVGAIAMFIAVTTFLVFLIRSRAEARTD